MIAHSHRVSSPPRPIAPSPHIASPRLASPHLASTTWSRTRAPARLHAGLGTVAHTEIPPAQLTCALRTLVHGTTLASSDASDGPQSTNGGSVCPPPCTCLHRRRHLNASGVSSSAVGQMASGLIEVRDLGGTPLVNIDYSHEHDRHLRSDPLPPPSRLTHHARSHACTLAGGRKALAVMTKCPIDRCSWDVSIQSAAEPRILDPRVLVLLPECRARPGQCRCPIQEQARSAPFSLACAMARMDASDRT
jgi:hypothetical protein